MRGDNHLLAITTTDPITQATKPLFSFPIQVCKATEAKEPRFDIAAPSGAPREQMFVDSATGEAVTDEQCQRGVRLGDAFHPIDAEQIAQIEEATKIKTMVALGTVELDRVPFERSTGFYFLQSPVKGGSPKAYRIVYEALLNPGGKPLAIVTKRTARSRQKLSVIYPDSSRGCLVMNELTFAAQLREPDAQVLAPQVAEVEQKQVAVARQVLANLGDGAVALDNETDDAIALRESLIEQALAGETLSAPTPVAESVQSDDLTALLEASLQEVLT